MRDAVGDSNKLVLYRAPFRDFWKSFIRLALGLVPALLWANISFAAANDDEDASGDQAHLQIFVENRYPSAVTCAECHPEQYKEWSVSPHAYAQMSPVFNAMSGAVVTLTNGTNGDFCIRCHNPVGMNEGEPVFMSNIDRSPTAREGITCVGCHRVNRAYGKISGRLAIVEGDIFDPVYGPTGNEEVARVIDSSDFPVNAERGKAGRAIHTKAEKFFYLPSSGFCGSCHDVNLVNGFRLEDLFSEYKTSPAAKRGVVCIDCHMGKEPGVDSGFDEGPAAIVGGKPTRIRKRSNHMFIGPDYSVLHPGIFPQNALAIREEHEKDDPRARGMATIREWLQFDWQAGWGTDEFEDNISDDFEFPVRWESYDDRFDARAIIDENIELLERADGDRKKILQAGFGLSEVNVKKAGLEKGLEFFVDVSNNTDGHGVPSGFDAERVMYLQVTVTDSSDKVVFRSGDLDPNGDVRDSHSIYVHAGALPLDRQLFSLQSRFLVRLIRGGERDQILPVNFTPDPLPFLRPSTNSTLLTGRPMGARKHKKGIEPNGSRRADYKIPASDLTIPGKYKINVKFKSGAVPPNLIHTISFVGFDYGLSARDVSDAIVKGQVLVWERETEIDIN